MYQKFYKLIVPATCVLCESTGTGELDLCTQCEADLPRNLDACITCALPLPPRAAGSRLPGRRCGLCLSTSKSRVTATVSPFLYRPPMDYMIKRLKFNGELKFSRILGDLMHDAAAQTITKFRPTALVPVPLHRSRLLQRGFNQSQLLADTIGKRLNITVLNDTVARTVAQSPQAKLNARARSRNTQRIFHTDQNLNGHRLVIIDDVYTTGATAHSLAGTLQRAGAEAVTIFTCARTP